MASTDTSASHAEDMAANLCRSFQSAMTQQRLFWEHMTGCARDESLRFVGRELERTGRMLENLQSCRDVSDLIEAQREWMRQTMRDFASQSLRAGSLMHKLTLNGLTNAVDASRDLFDQGERNLRQAADQAAQAADDVARTGSQAGSQASSQIDQAESPGSEGRSQPYH